MKLAAHDGSTPRRQNDIRVIDDAGRSFGDSAPRIVSLMPAATEMICSIGLRDQLVGVSHQCNWPPEVATLPRVSRGNVDATAQSCEIDRQVKKLLEQSQSLYEIDAVTLADLRPTLIVAQSQCDVCAVSDSDVRAVVARQEQLRHVNVIALNPQSLDDTLGDIQRIGAAAGADKAARQVCLALRQRVQKVREATKAQGDAPRPRVAVIEWVDPLMIAGNWVPAIIRDAGGEYAMAEDGVHSRYVEWSDVAAYSPELLVIAPCGFDLQRSIVEARMLEQLPGWSDLPAVVRGHAYVVDGDAYFNCPGPRQIDALETLALAVNAAASPPVERQLPDGWQRFSDIAGRCVR